MTECGENIVWYVAMSNAYTFQTRELRDRFRELLDEWTRTFVLFETEIL